MSFQMHAYHLIYFFVLREAHLPFFLIPSAQFRLFPYVCFSFHFVSIPRSLNFDLNLLRRSLNTQLNQINAGYVLILINIRVSYVCVHVLTCSAHSISSYFFGSDSNFL